ncbi:MAG TPA: tetratricopeptide repeat protein [Candidatus Methanoperedens sp.]|nr:tetratricopeptide repeat protein [Candidatus Methanoperedens sp.]
MKLHAYYAFLLALSGRKTEALEHYKIAIEVPPRYPLEHFNYAVLLEKLDMITEAEEHYKKAIKINPEFAEAHNNYAVLLTALNRKDEAEEHYKKALEINPNFVEAHNNYANFLRQKMQLLEAEKEVYIALRIEPQNPYSLGILGDILADEGLDFIKSIEAYDEALENSDPMKDSVISEIRNNLGWIYVQLRKYSKAKEEFKKAIHLDPLNVKARHNLRALGKIGLDLEQEISQVQKYLSILLSLSLIVLFFSFLVYNRPSETVFAAQSITLVALLIFILFYHQITKFKAGAIEFEKSTELRSQYIEDISLRDLRALVEAIL